MRSLQLAVVLFVFTGVTAAWGQASAQSSGPATVTMSYSNPALAEGNWTLELHPDGSGHYQSRHNAIPGEGARRMEARDVDRPVQLSTAFASHVFAVAAARHGFALDCESHAKVAFQGTKTLSYEGPLGKGSCTYNYSNDKEIQALGDDLQAVATTLEEGARLQMLALHDRLGLDREMEYLLQAAHDGRARQLGTIRETLERLASDDAILERVRRRALQVLAVQE